MNVHIWTSLLTLTGGLTLAGPAAAQSLAGLWQGAENPTEARYYPSVLRLQRGTGDNLFGIWYEEVGPEPNITVTFQVRGRPTGNGLVVDNMRKLDETGATLYSHWCAGSITFTYDPALEKLTGRATYQPDGNCNTGVLVFYRVRLKSAATVKAGALSTLRVSGRDVRWYADAAQTKLLATGNAYPTRLSKTTTFYITQGFFPSAESQAVPITVSVTPTGKVKVKTKPGNAPAVAARPTSPPALPPLDTVRRRPPVVATPPAATPAPTLPTGPTPLLLPTVLFRQSTPELLPSAYEALDQLAAALKEQPAVRLRIVGHTDRLAQDDPAKNQQLSEQRAEAVKQYLVKAGIEPARLETAGYGDTRRLYPSPDVRNRRVEVERL